MRQILVWLVFCVIAAPVWADDVADETTAIQTMIRSYTEAFNSADAEKLAEHWTPGGEYVTPDGRTLRGREQLQQEFAALFGDGQKRQLELVGTTVELMSPSVAVESGVARVIVPDQEPGETQYRAMHVKTADGWRIDSVREAAAPPEPPSHYQQLQPLEWMIGRWSNADEEGDVDTTCRWTRNRNFISRSFQVRIGEDVDFEGTQVIGWDPVKQTIRSWLFDSDGGFAAGRWSQDGERWTVQTLHVMPDGRLASATNIYDVIDDKRVRFQSVGRQVDGELLPNIGPIEMVRSSEE